MAYSRPNSKLSMIQKYIDLKRETPDLDEDGVAETVMDIIEGILKEKYAVRRVMTTRVVALKD